MADLDKRIITIEIDVAGGKKRMEGMSVEVSASKNASAVANEAEIKIANMARADREYLITSTSPMMRPRRYHGISVWMGYESSGITRIFKGDIVSAQITQPPDIWLNIKAMTGYFSRGEVLARTAPAQTRLSVLAEGVASDLGLTLDFQARDKSIANYSFTGGAYMQVDKLGQAGLVDAYVDDDKLIVKDRGKGLVNRVRKLSEENGMIGIPVVDERGIRVRMLFDPFTTVGTVLDVTSRMNPAANGRFTVYKLRYTGATRNTPFYIDADALRPGLGGLVL